ncbi:peroxisomal targeting signal type 2 receptor [Perkinsela sp. CCAP 1560/4]|nr:peroxisomal targeting signal type 2 receptor [Perkinsela sp. CCAP 1560/4]|eukprot:KNH04275.1 peroxisomal targeting signal type 2 receptor [Perkinsela sp. CCAP 1560/4]
MGSFQLHPNFAGTSVSFSPWEPGRIIVSAAANFGVFGKGAVYCLRIPQNEGLQVNGSLRCEFISPMNDACYDVSFAECANNVFVAATGDGIKIIQHENPQQENGNPVICEPVGHLSEHRGEVSSVNFNNVQKTMFASGSNDQTVKIWDINRLSSVSTMFAHEKEVYEVSWSPHSAFHIASCAGDGALKIWDIRHNPGYSNTSVRGSSLFTAQAGSGILSVDWNKYSNMLASSSIDNKIRLWDLRKLEKEVLTLHGHDAAVRRVRWSPHSRSTLLSAGYDFRCCVWDINHLTSETGMQNPLIQRYHHHSEFVIGIGWSLFERNQVASCGFDGHVYSWTLGNQPVRTPSRNLPFPTVTQSKRVTPSNQGRAPREVI